MVNLLELVSKILTGPVIASEALALSLSKGSNLLENEVTS